MCIFLRCLKWKCSSFLRGRITWQLGWSKVNWVHLSQFVFEWLLKGKGERLKDEEKGREVLGKGGGEREREIFQYIGNTWLHITRAQDRQLSYHYWCKSVRKFELSYNRDGRDCLMIGMFKSPNHLVRERERQWEIQREREREREKDREFPFKPQPVCHKHTGSGNQSAVYLWHDN